MYCFDGLYRQCWIVVVGAILCIGSLVASHFWSAKKINKRRLAEGIFWLVATVYMGWYCIGAVLSPNILSHEGTLLAIHRTHNSLSSMDYTFSNSDGLKPVFELDSFTRKKIYPQGLEEGKTYRIYYEARTTIIVGIEEIAP